MSRTVKGKRQTASQGRKGGLDTQIKSSFGVSPAAHFAPPHSEPPSSQASILKLTKDIRGVSGFGFGCSYEEHVQFGQCLDGKCSQRAPWEKIRTEQVVLRKNMNKKGTLPSTPAEIQTLVTPANAPKPALHYAVMYGNRDLVADLLHQGFDLNAVDERQQTPLMIAAQKGFVILIKMILSATTWIPKLKIHREPADLSLTDLKGKTALHYAAAAKHADCVSILLKHGAPPYTRDLTGKIALDLALDQNTWRVIKAFCSEQGKETLSPSFAALPPD